MRATGRRIAVVLICVATAFTCEIVLAEPLYRFGVPPWQRGQSADDIRRLYEPLLDYLGRATNAKITVVTARNYEDMVHYFADGRVDPVHEHRRPEELTNEELMAIAAGGLRKAPQVRFRVGHVREL